MLDQTRLKQLVNYDPETGEFTSRVLRGQWTLGKRLGTRNRTGDLYINIDRHKYLVHQLAWLYVHGVLPTGDLDRLARSRFPKMTVEFGSTPS